MSAPYVPSVFVPGQQQSNGQQQNTGQTYGQAYVPGQQQHPPSNAYVPPAQQQQYNVNQSQVYVPGQQQFQDPARGPSQQAYVPQSSQAYVPGQPSQHQVYASPPQQANPPQVYAPGYVPGQDDPNGERGLLANTAKLGLGVGAAALAYNAYNQYQQQQQQQQTMGAPMQLQQHAYGQPQQAYGQSTAQPQQPQQRKGVLTIYLDQCTNLANKDFLSKSDPYVKLSIEQDNWVRDMDYGKQFSSRKTDQLNPVYNEMFTFNLPTLENMVLKIKVMDDDGGFSRDDKLGWCKIKLWELGLNNNPTPVERVIDRNVFTKNGKVMLRLAYSGKM